MSSEQWIVVGASSSGRAMLSRAVARRPAAATIATNAAIRLFRPPRLDYYLLFDMVAGRTYHDEAMAAQAEGTHLITAKRNHPALRVRGLDRFDEFIELEHPGKRQFHRGRYTDPGLSGLMILQYAVNNGATEISLVGMEGYGPDDGKRLDRHTKVLIEPFTQSVVTACPDVRFLVYGTPRYAITGKNVEHVEVILC